MGQTTLESSLARDGGAILAISGALWVYGTKFLAYNTAVNGGGGIYLEGSDLEIIGNCNISQNQAIRGGGILASASIITVYQQGMLTLHNNIADKGGGVYLESNARLYLSKSVPELSIFNSTIHTIMQFTGIHAIYGGAVYVADNTNSGDCKPAQECPLQMLVTDSTYGENHNFLNMIFSEDNSATIAGSNLYGGLLDRCIPNPFAEVHQQWFERILSLYYNGVTYLRNIRMRVLTVKDSEGFSELYEGIASPADENDSFSEEVPCPIREAVSSSYNYLIEDKEEPLKECGEDASDQQEFDNGDQTQGIEGEKENRIRY